MKEKSLARLHRRGFLFGCGQRMVDAGDCLALAVQERGGHYRIVWGHFGKMLPPKACREFSLALRWRAGRKPVWVPLLDREAEMNMAIHSVDLETRDSRGHALVATNQPESFIRTQVGKHVPTPSDDDRYVYDRMTVDAGCDHVLGAVARGCAADEAYRFWRHDVGVHSPHIGAIAIGLANTALALLPDFGAHDSTARLIVLEKYQATYGCYFRGLRLHCALRYESAQGERLHPGLLNLWHKTLRQDVGLQEQGAGVVSDEQLDVRIVQSWPMEDKPPEIDPMQIWNPWESNRLVWPDKAARALLLEHLDLAPVAFGLALQGG